MLKRRTHILAFVFGIGQTPLIAALPVWWDSPEQKISVGRNIAYLEDASKDKSIMQVSAPAFQAQFVDSSGDTLNFGQTNHDYWLRITFERRSSETRSRVLEIDQSNIDIVEFYAPDGNGGYTMHAAGMLYPFWQRPIRNRNFVFAIDLNPGEKKTFYMRARTCGGLIMPFVLWDKEAFNEYNANVQHGLGLYYGIMIVMILYNLFIYFSVRDISYFYYVCYISGLLWLQLVLTGHGFQYLWPNGTWLQRNAYILSSNFMLASVLMFSKRFLNTKELVPWLDKAFKVSIGVLVVLFFSPMVLPPEITTKATLAVTIPPLIMVFAAAVIAFMRKYRPARFFLLAFTVLQIAGIIVVLKFVGVLGSNVLTDYGLYFGSALEVVLLSIALADRINIMKKEKEEAQRKTLEMQKVLTESYARFVPRDFLANLGKESILDVRLGDQVQKNMAVLFSDIRSFTTMSEAMSPTENFNFINSYLGRMSPIIQRHGGFIDKFIGDAIMALFEKSVADAVGAGVEMQRYLKEYNTYRAAKGYQAIEIGVGVHAGSLMLGTIGAEDRLEGTVISDTVNLASRIESLTKIYAARIAVSETTIAEIKPLKQFRFRFLDRVTVKGKSKPVGIYEIIDGDEESVRELKLKSMDDYLQAVTAYHEGRLADAKEAFARVLKIYPADRPSLVYESRLATA
ncbi:MAG: 7TM diverse intracellular signaling domain-containing protein [Spirochaetota bacterium]